MRFIGTISAVLVFFMGLAVLSVDGGLARAQSVDDASREVEAANGLVDEAIDVRAGLELELAASIARVNDLSAQLSSVSVTLGKLEAQISFADAEMVGINNDLQHQAVEGYMTALSAPGVTLANTENVEKALVAGLVVEDVVNAGRQVVDELVVKKRDLQQLQEDFLAKEAEVAALKDEVDAEMAKLERLYAEADAALAEAIQRANAADSAYREALSSVEAAQAAEAESQREENRGTTSTSQPPNSSTTSTTTPGSTTSTTSGGGGGWTFPPAVEQWRGLVQQHFPANRVEEALRIMQCESGGDPNAYNPYSGASGLFQFLPSTWASTAPQAGYGGYSVFDPVANTASAAWLANRYEELGEYYWRAWSCRRVLN